MKINFRSLLGSNKFILIISVILSVCIWINMSLSSDNVSTVTISNIPIQINLSEVAIENGLQIFSGNDQTASVTVTGNRVALGSINPEDIVISAQTAGTITSTGNITLSLSARKTNASDNFEITSPVSPSVITIFVDYSKRTTLDIENRIRYNIADGYHGEVTLSADKITLQGPLSEISKVETVAIDGEIPGLLTKSAELQCDIKLYDATGSEVNSSMITTSENLITANVSVSPEKEVPLKVNFANAPSGIHIDNFIAVSPKSIHVAGPADVLDKLEYVSTEEIDFSTLRNKKSIHTLELNLPENCINLNENKTAKVTVDLSNFSKRTINSKKLSVVGTNHDYNYNVTTDSLAVAVNGNKSQLGSLTSSDIICEIDASKLDGSTGSLSLPVKIKILGADTCWAYGSYKANVNITKK